MLNAFSVSLVTALQFSRFFEFIQDNTRPVVGYSSVIKKHDGGEQTLQDRSPLKRSLLDRDVSHVHIAGVLVFTPLRDLHLSLAKLASFA